MDIDTALDTVAAIPDISLRPVASVGAPPTVGRLAARVHGLAARPADWWHLVAFDPAAPLRVPLPGGLYAATWPPGHRTDVHGQGPTEVIMLAAGELTEVTISPDGVAERPLRTNRIRVHGSHHTHQQLHNPGVAYAITLHAPL